jgi:hypothetical protein
MSAANDEARESSVMALPPYFTTMIRPQNLRMYGRASIRTSAAA